MTKLDKLIASLLAADEVPLSDAWKKVIDRAAELEDESTIQNDLDAVKRIRGWKVTRMCQFCGTVATIDEITAKGGLSCCPERRMKDTLTPPGYKDPDNATF